MSERKLFHVVINRAPEIIEYIVDETGTVRAVDVQRTEESQSIPTMVAEKGVYASTNPFRNPQHEILLGEIDIVQMRTDLELWTFNQRLASSFKTHVEKYGHGIHEYALRSAQRRIAKAVQEFFAAVGLKEPIV